MFVLGHECDLQGRHGLWEFGRLRWLLDLQVYLLVGIGGVDLAIHG